LGRQDEVLKCEEGASLSGVLKDWPKGRKKWLFTRSSFFIMMACRNPVSNSSKQPPFTVPGVKRQCPFEKGCFWSYPKGKNMSISAPIVPPR
jgi:hypothetical protein